MYENFSTFKITNRIFNECSFIFEKINPTPLQNMKILHLNLPLYKKLNFIEDQSNQLHFKNFINAELQSDQFVYASTYYSGHQFGHYVPQLGDGRATTLVEIQNSLGDFFELQMKGSGPTPFSRMGDGKAVIRSCIREYLASAHLKALNIPTTEALSLTIGSESVARDEIEKEGMVVRVAESFLRFGHFQFFSKLQDQSKLDTLLNFTIQNYFANISDSENKYYLFLKEITERTAELFAKWQCIGFCHGVLNTDNMSILGLTLDYGPYGFIENLDFNHICNHSDHQGRYSFGNQPTIGLWNIQQLAHSLNKYLSKDEITSITEIYSTAFFKHYRNNLKLKCGLYEEDQNDLNLLNNLQIALVNSKIDYTLFFRNLSYENFEEKLNSSSKNSKEIDQFIKDYKIRLKTESLSSSERSLKMLQNNPKFILRNYLAQICIEDHSQIELMFKVLTAPYEEWTEHEEWAKETPAKYCDLEVSCSS